MSGAKVDLNKANDKRVPLLLTDVFNLPKREAGKSEFLLPQDTLADIVRGAALEGKPRIKGHELNLITQAKD